MKEINGLSNENVYAVEEDQCLQKIIQEKYFELKELPEVQEFIKDSKNEILLSEAFQKGELETVRKLNISFQEFQTINRKRKAINYSVGIIRIYSKDYDKRVNKRNNRNLLILDKPVKDSSESPTALMIELIQDHNQKELSKSLFVDNQFEFENDNLEKSYTYLSNFQKELLNLKYVEGYSQREISRIIGQTEQNIYYWHRKTIKQLQMILSSNLGGDIIRG
ncbi:sigma factor-like helix-turn-helix DNA-binding protein [Lysinibacillus sp. FSL H8-0500]|uniref:sigma factor-like helix-turn-helix DNA-binding protein n=1 Tax=Lysinibacillus sp. FSL H8-0500 TaxID=2921393 RepID=UPI003100ED10